MTLTEVLTLQRPNMGRCQTTGTSSPKELDESFRIVIRNCLKLDASSRWTISEIKSLLQPARAPAAKVTRGSKSSVWYYVIPIVILIALGIVLSRIKQSESAFNEVPKIKVETGVKPSASAPVAQPRTTKGANPAVGVPKPKPACSRVENKIGNVANLSRGCSTGITRRPGIGEKDNYRQDTYSRESRSGWNRQRDGSDLGISKQECLL